MDTYVSDPNKLHDEIQRDTGEIENITKGAYHCNEMQRYAGGVQDVTYKEVTTARKDECKVYEKDEMQRDAGRIGDSLT